MKVDQPQVTRGVLLPDGLYTREGLWEFAKLGLAQLMQAESEGKLDPVKRGNNYYYLGRDVIAWVMQGKRKSANPAN